MSAQNPASAGGPVVEGPHDPEHDPRASYALEPEYTAALTARLVATTGQTAEVRSPLDDAPLAHIPQSSARRRGRGVRPGPQGAVGLGRAPRSTARGALLLRLHDLVLDRQDEIIDLIVLGVRQGPQARLRRAAARRADRPLLRAYGAPHLDTERSSASCPVLTRVEVNRVPKGVVGIISPWNYPFTLALCDGLAGAAGRQRRRRQARRPDHALRAARRRAARARPASRGTSGRSSPGPARRSAARSSSAPTTSASPARPPPAAPSRRRCADRLIGCSLELGGKNPLLVLRDADLEKAAEGAVRASFSNSGQLCVSMERIFVADQVYDRFVGALRGAHRGDDARRHARLGQRHGLR